MRKQKEFSQHPRKRWRMAIPVLLLLGLIGAGYQQVTQRLDRKTYSPPGQIITVDGIRTHLHCTGTGNPTVICKRVLSVLPSFGPGFKMTWRR